MIQSETKHIKYHKGLKYQLSENAKFETEILGYVIMTEYIQLTADGCLYIKEGYSWDGASGPTIDTKSSMRGSLLHDALYQLLRLELLPQPLRILADKELWSRCMEDKMIPWRADVWRWILNEWGAPAAHPDNKRIVYTAP